MWEKDINYISQKISDEIEKLNYKDFSLKLFKDELFDIFKSNLLEFLNISQNYILNLVETISIKELFYEKDISSNINLVKNIRNLINLLDISEISFYIKRWEILYKQKFSLKTIELKKIKINDVQNINIKNLLFNKEWLLKKKYWLIYSDISVEWKWEDFAIKIWDKFLLSWDDYWSAFDIDKNNVLDILLTISKLLKNKYIESIWEKDHLTWLHLRKWFKFFLETFDKWYLVILDIDNFKKINDNFWHDIWDKVIKEISNLLINENNNWNLSARWWWEEFLLFFPNLTNKKDIEKKLEKLLNKIRWIKIKELWWLQITVSWWADVFNKNNFEKTIKLADTKLYISKSSWKNRITY